MILLFKDIRAAMDKSGRSLELTFTIPASFWYLRWFHVPALLKYHGSGSIVYPHINLSEIKLAAELLWRNDISPSQGNIGYGFYGRSFMLADSSCYNPGCAFGDAAKPIYLEHYEPMDFLAKNSITPVWAKEAVVKHFTSDGNQWVSFDDEETFKQKRDWANDVGVLHAPRLRRRDRDRRVKNRMAGTRIRAQSRTRSLERLTQPFSPMARSCHPGCRRDGRLAGCGWRGKTWTGMT
ncbi:Chitinase, putative [Tolypocladium paradoxum]|uniref:chitinase n=1 Tax=Tolypocladium paradoxum TaxID=94208 RepID=A0A2S4L5Z0_9HYPO|nr:Chitinase, putative [Tolypocladium paradoxum]